jgi:small-conductance mechanosensitive channel
LYFIGLSAIRVLLDAKLYSFKVQKKLPFYKACLQMMLLGICASEVSLGFIGYLRLGYILDIMITFGIGLIMVLYILISFLNYLSHSLQRPTQDGFKGSIYRFLDLEKNSRFFEIPLLFYSLSISIIIIFSFSVMENIWQVPAKFRFFLGDILLIGYKYGQLEFNFPTLFYSSFSLLLMSILGRIAGGLFIQISQKKLGLTQKEIIKKIFRFFFLFLGTLISMDIIGFDIRSLSFMIGAFSVGIGFGLKNVASDIIAGITIMFQKNLRLKDHIEVNGIEGYIEKINLFTTEIRTLDNTNLIIPNSKITNSSVVNHTFQNNLWTSSLQFIISDLDKLELAKKIIVQSLKKCPEIITTEPHNPEVLLQTIKANGNTIPCLVVRFSLKNEEKYPKASSQLNYEIVKAFKLNDILLNK